ncbi:MAG TPA: heme biosynthesis HemY N-terminal domain-containing protein [Alphaproteobacteria bacterium]|nr:heme biosynthesis HemY N-terminal domain-containing protein [Alphaproteobacteria bacterium]
MARATVFLLILAVIAGGIAWIADHPGAVSIAWEGYRIDTSVGVLIAAAALTGAAAAILYRFWRILRGAPQALVRRRREGRRIKGYRALTQGMVAVAAGDAEEARRQARRADLLLKEPPLTMLLAAQAAQLNGDEAAAEKYFTAMLERPETEFLGLRGLIMQTMRKGETARALELARRARSLRPRTGWVLTTLHELEVRAGDWRAAEETARLAVKAKAMTAEAARRNRAIARYEQSLAAEAAGQPEPALSRAVEAAELDPGLVAAVVRAAMLLARADKSRRARHLIEDAWSRAPHPALAKAYLDLEQAVTPLERVMRVQKLIARHPDDRESRLALAEAALAARLWGEARRALEAVDGPGTARVCQLWAALEEAEHGDGAAARAWLARAARAPLDPAWICGHCGTAHAEWLSLCHRCGAYDSLAWRSPERVTATPLPPPPAPLPAAAVEPPPPAEAATDLGTA